MVNAENKIFTSVQVKNIDEYTIKKEPIASIDLMERAAKSIFNYFNEVSDIKKESFTFFIGSGNNGGDGLALARMLLKKKSKVKVYILSPVDKLSEDCKINYNRLKETEKNKISFLSGNDSFPEINKNDIIIDAIFGSGLKRPVKGFLAKITDKINELDNTKISIDIPSGLMGEDNAKNTGAIIRADITLTLQFPFLSMFFSENSIYVGSWEVIPIGLHRKAIEETDTDFYLITEDMMRNYYKPRKRFDHKGNFGHALLVAGSYGKAGASVLATKSCLRTGVGLITTHVPALVYDVLQTTVPEAMASIDNSKKIFTGIENIEEFDAIGIGPGVGTDLQTEIALIELLKRKPSKLVIDADGLNILSKTERFLELLPEKTILTPHPKEFERLFGKFDNTYQKIVKMKKVSQKNKIIIIYKAGNTIISLPDGKVFFNQYGNPGMATAGSGDVLTGMILALLSQNYSPETASLLGVFLHSIAGDFAKEICGNEALIATDIIENIAGAFSYITSEIF